jgi:hypothetical protein
MGLTDEQIIEQMVKDTKLCKNDQTLYVASELKSLYKVMKNYQLPNMETVEELSYFMRMYFKDTLDEYYDSYVINSRLLSNVDQIDAKILYMSKLFDLTKITNIPKFSIWFVNKAQPCQLYENEDDLVNALSLLRSLVKNCMIDSKCIFYTIGENYYPLSKTPKIKKFSIKRFNTLNSIMPIFDHISYKNYKVNSSTSGYEPEDNSIWYFDMTLIKLLSNHPEYFTKIKLGVFIGTKDEIKAYKIMKDNFQTPFKIIEQLKDDINNLEIIEAFDAEGGFDL